MKWVAATYKVTEVNIDWDDPIPIEDAYIIEKNSNLYKLIGIDKFGKYYLIYVGKCIKQKFTKRIFQRDHKLKQEAFKEKNKNLKMLVSIGHINNREDNKPKLISDLESLLIYSHSDEGFPKLINKQCTLTHNVIKNYLITNKGWRKEGMYKSIGYGLFMSKS